ncbi:Fur family transcriptional regulator [Amaricoccus tamworthensis]|uniref:Fur family transcriptional regulator n=1 Tax=Amaricoccus tamworthensis TaxID=57002 RepID=UPI003C7C1313
MPASQKPVAPKVDAFQPHDHRRCRATAMAEVRARCEQEKLRLTPARESVLNALLETHRAMTAYELLDRLRDDGLPHQPPVAYRALDFLVEHGFAHRIERLSAFVACTHGSDHHAAAFLVCRGCRTVAESKLPAPIRGIEETMSRESFTVERLVVEAEGLCAACAEAGTETP